MTVNTVLVKIPWRGAYEKPIWHCGERNPERGMVERVALAGELRDLTCPREISSLCTGKCTTFPEPGILAVSRGLALRKKVFESQTTLTTVPVSLGVTNKPRWMRTQVECN